MHAHKIKLARARVLKYNCKNNLSNKYVSNVRIRWGYSSLDGKSHLPQGCTIPHDDKTMPIEEFSKCSLK